MKHYTIIFCLLVLSQFLFAQQESPARSFVVGGGFSFSTQTNYAPTSLVDFGIGTGLVVGNNSDDAKRTSFAIRPTIGKQLTEKLLVGLLLDYRSINSTSTVSVSFPQPNVYDYESNANEYSIGLFTRHSFVPGKRFDFFLQPFAHYSVQRDETFVDDQISSEEKANYFAAGSDVGVLYNISDRFRATTRFGGLRYVSGSWEEVGTDEGNDFSSFGLSLNLTTIYFGVEMKL